MAPPVHQKDQSKGYEIFSERQTGLGLDISSKIIEAFFEIDLPQT